MLLLFFLKNTTGTINNPEHHKLSFTSVSHVTEIKGNFGQRVVKGISGNFFFGAKVRVFLHQCK